mgnify:CR=1 FL=1
MEKLENIYMNPDVPGCVDCDSGWRAKVADVAVRFALWVCKYSPELTRVRHLASGEQVDEDQREVDRLLGDIALSHRHRLDAEQQIDVLKRMVKNREAECRQMREKVEVLEAVAVTQKGKIVDLECELERAHRSEIYANEQLRVEMCRRVSNFK